MSAKTQNTVRLRNGMLAEVWFLHPSMVVEPFALIGEDAEGVTHMWGRDGRWQEHGRPHRFDIVSHTFQPPEESNGTYDSNPIS